MKTKKPSPIIYQMDSVPQGLKRVQPHNINFCSFTKKVNFPGWILNPYQLQNATILEYNYIRIKNHLRKKIRMLLSSKKMWMATQSLRITSFLIELNYVSSIILGLLWEEDKGIEHPFRDK